MPLAVGGFLLAPFAGTLAGIGGIAGLGTAAGTTIAGVSLAEVVGSAAILGATIGLQYALAPAKPTLPTPESGSQAVKQAFPSRIKAYGTNRLSGAFMAFEAVGAAPANSYDVMAFHSGRIGSVAGFFLHDDVVRTVSDISLGGFSEVIADYADGRYGPNVVLEVALGTTTQAASVLLTSDPLIGWWTSAHQGKGIAWVAMKCYGASTVPLFTQRFPHQLPTLSVVANCSVIWDPRDPSQSRFNEATWQVRLNPVIQLIDYLTASEAGPGLDYDTVIAPNLAAWMVEANLCDELVATATGTEPRYQSSGWFNYDNKPEDVIGGILSTCDGWMAESGDGTLSLTVGVYREPTDPPLTEKHIMGFALNYGQANEQTVNQLDISFTDPNQKYVSVQTEPWKDEESISISGVINQPIDLKWVQSNSQARRLADRAMMRLNPAMTGSFTTSLYGMRYLGKRWVPLHYPFVSGLQNCVVEIQSADVDLMAGRIVWEFIRIGDDIEAYDPATDQGTTPIVPPPIVTPVCPQAAAFLARTSGLNSVHTNAYVALICGLVADGIWAKLDLLHIYATQDSTTALLNLVSTSFNGTLYGSPTFTADRGFTGTSGSSTIYIDTGFNPITAASPKYVQNSAHLSVWAVNNITDNSAGLGATNSGTSNAYILPRYADAFAYWRVNVPVTNNPSFNTGFGSGHFLGNRTGVNALGCYRNAALQTTDTIDTSTAPPNFNFYSLGYNIAGTASGNAHQQAMISVGSSLSSTDVTNFYSRLRTYMTAVGVP